MSERFTFTKLVRANTDLPRSRERGWNLSHWQQRHDSAVLAWQADRATLTANERMVLDALHGFWQICQLHGGDGFVREHVIIPMHIALSDLLNVELDRLDGGTLSGFLAKVAEDLDLTEVM
jgi:hypothetical protein